jgi:PDZ domain-containing protein
VRRVVTPSRLVIAGLALLAAVLALMVVPSNEVIFLPDTAHPVAPIVTFQGSKDPTSGGVYYVDVFERKASLLERLFGGLHNGADLYPADAVNPPGVGDKGRRRIDQQDMHRSQEIAAAVALKAAGEKVTLRATGALIDAVQPGKPAVGKLEPDDVVVALNGRTVISPSQIFAAMSKVRIGAIVRFTVRRGAETLVEPIKTVRSEDRPTRPVVGVLLEPSIDIQLPFPVRIDVGNVGGPSAGLAFALEVMEELGRNVVHGHKIAATGELEPDGSVLPIGGIKQKTIGAREAGVDAFLVPAGDNAKEARKYADGLRIIPVESFPQALRALATLGRTG